jgi:hypothetical protein
MIHALVTIGAVGIARSAGSRHTARPRSHLVAVMIATAAILMMAHTLEVVVWALAHAIVVRRPATPTCSISPSSTTPRSVTAISRLCKRSG